MKQFIATACKELLLLRRDRSGLLVLFFMPAVLVLVITLVQENVLKTMGETGTDILFLDQDRGMVGQRMTAALSEADGVVLVNTLDGRQPDKATALQAVARGDFQLCLYIPKGMTSAVKAKARRAALRALSMTGESDDPSPDAELEVYFDPTVMGGFRSAVKHMLHLMVMQIEVQEKLDQVAVLLPEKFQSALEEALGPMAAGMPAGSSPDFNLQWTSEPIIKIREASALETAAVKMPTAVQQNVPAWSLFGIFFIVLPMAGSFIKERLYGVEQRILSMPVSYLAIVAGKAAAYMLVCWVQFGLILIIGKVLLPLMGSPAFELGSAASLTVVLVAFSAILGATGYGILLGTVARSYEQASMFGPISIVIAAALGGIMVPVYAMPVLMQKISVVSPLAWAQNAFLELFVRGGDLQAVMPQVALLMIFASACVGTASLLFIRRIRKGRF